MNQVVLPGELSGKIDIPSSKSQAHRLLICAALSAAPVSVSLRGMSQDILATCDCLHALGADIREQDGGLLVTPISDVPKTEVMLACRESGSTLRFLLPVCGMLGVNAVFCCEGRLAQRPLSPLDEELRAHGMEITQNGNQIICRGKLTAGTYTLPGNVSSQFFTGLFLALPHLPGESTLRVTGKLESAPYIAMTGRVLELCGARMAPIANGWLIPGNQILHLPSFLTVEGDWSNAAMFLCAGALSQRGVKVRGIRTDSAQGDRTVCSILQQFGANVRAGDFSVTVSKNTLHGIEIDASQIPDLIPVLSVVAAYAEGETRIYHAARLRLKESDRIASTTAMLHALGADAEELPDGIIIRGKARLSGGTVDSFSDHRIAMSAAIAASNCETPVTIVGSEAVCKSYPNFFDDHSTLKGAQV